MYSLFPTKSVVVLEQSVHARLGPWAMPGSSCSSSLVQWFTVLMQ
uniref:Uncharacterized protein n=1 Tax=Anguilla anguilla TaxID=7936 RepID=A0A0E9U0M3_ANGAN